MENNYKLYVHICPNGKRYYGITKLNINQRWQNGRGYKNNQHFMNAIEKYGWDNIEHIVLFDSLTECEAKELEQYYIQWYNTANRKYGYNISLGGESANGFHHSEESKRKISDSLKGENSYWYGKQFSDEHKQNLSKNHANVKGANNPFYGKGYLIAGTNHPMYGKHHSDETKKKISDAKKGLFIGENNPMARTVICVTTGKIFSTIKEGADYYNINGANISQCCGGKRKSAGKSPTGEKLIWKYIDIKEIV